VVSAASTSVAEATAALLQPGGPSDGEDPEKPFVLLTVLVELGEGMCSFNGMLHGGALLAILDEALCAAADNQSSESPPMSSVLRIFGI
jgi:acyl-CoA hydrolase